MSGVVFVDIETTGLNPGYHDIWEVALIVDEEEFTWQMIPDLTRADSGALRVSRFYERANKAVAAENWDNPQTVAGKVAVLTANRHLVGAVPSFDAGFLSRFLHRQGFRDAWHYHLIDVEALAIGYLWGIHDMESDEIRRAGIDTATGLPWDSEALSRVLGVDPDKFDRHTALGDARWAKAIYEAVVG